MNDFKKKNTTNYQVNIILYKKPEKCKGNESLSCDLGKGIVMNPFQNLKDARKVADALYDGCQQFKSLKKSDVETFDRIEVTVDKFSWDGDYVGCCQKDVLKFR